MYIIITGAGIVGYHIASLLAEGKNEVTVIDPVETVMDIVRQTEEFKPNCNLVIIDFLIRHGLLSAGDRGYAQLVSDLHRSL